MQEIRRGLAKYHKYRISAGRGISNEGGGSRYDNNKARLGHHLFKVVLSVILAFSLFGLSGCSLAELFNKPKDPVDAPDTNSDNKDTNTALDNAPYDRYTKKDGTWAVYWYLCGSDIELRENVAYTATGQLQKMMKVTLPDNVTVVIQAGGAKKWHLQGIDPSLTNILVYRGNTLKVVETKPLANMGDPNTFADFLAYCNKNYPAENQVVMIYNHGGGSLYGIAFDALHNSDSLTLPEISQVIKARPAASGMYELVDLSACLMSTIDTIAVFNGYTRYLTASEEVRLGCAWDYTKVFNVFVNDPKPNGAKLGKVIADGYMTLCESVGYTNYTTLSVIDMAYADELLTAYNNVGIELLNSALRDGSEYIAAFGRAAYASENYGAMKGPTSDYDMVDLGDLMINAKDLLPKSSDAMIRAIKKVVVYQVTNPVKEKGLGISCFYPFTNKETAYKRFFALETSPAFYYYYEYVTTGNLSTEAQKYLASLATSPTPTPTPAPLPEPSKLGLDGVGLSPHGNGVYWLELGKKADNVAAVYLLAGQYVPSAGNFVLYGTRDCTYQDWEFGMFYDVFDAKWGSIDGSFCYMEAVSKGPGIVLYRVPVYHNGILKDMMVAYSYTEPNYYQGQYYIMGLITTSSPETNAAEAIYEKLQIGDVIEPILLSFNQDQVRKSDYSGTATVSLGTAITVSSNTRFSEKSLGDGFFMISFVMIDYTGAWHFSKNGFYSIKNGIFDFATM